MTNVVSKVIGILFVLAMVSCGSVTDNMDSDASLNSKAGFKTKAQNSVLTWGQGDQTWANNYSLKVLTNTFDLTGKALIGGGSINPVSGLSSDYGISYSVSGYQGFYIDIGASIATNYSNNGNILTVILTVRTFNSYYTSYGIVYTVQVAYTNKPDYLLSIYDDVLTRGAGNYLLTGDGPNTGTTVNFNSADAAAGSSAIEVKVNWSSYGSHWKLMLFANGNSAAYAGINLSGYSKIRFSAKASRNVNLNADFGCAGDDTGYKGLGLLSLTQGWQTFEFDITTFNGAPVNRSDINSLLWLTMHSANNPMPWNNVSVFVDQVQFVK